SSSIASATTANQWREGKADNPVPPPGATDAYILLRTYQGGTYTFDDVVFAKKDNDLALNKGAFPVGTYAPPSLLLLQNTGFELSGSGRAPSFWTTNVATGTAAQTWDATTVYTGSRAARTVMSTGGQADWRQLISGIDPSLRYRLRAKILA